MAYDPTPKPRPTPGELSNDRSNPRPGSMPRGPVGPHTGGSK